MRKLEAIKVKGVQREGKKEKKVLCGVGDKQRAKEREEHFYYNHNCTHTHTLATNICTTDTANV
jgi:hypothetical protein